MRNTVEIENIEELRRREGIDDIELWEEIRGLRTGDFVKLTFRAGEDSFGGETLLVRITGIRGPTFRGELTRAPTAPGLSGLRVGLRVSFTAEHIHSLPRGRPTRE